MEYVFPCILIIVGLVAFIVYHAAISFDQHRKEAILKKHGYEKIKIGHFSAIHKWESRNENWKVFSEYEVSKMNYKKLKHILSSQI